MIPYVGLPITPETTAVAAVSGGHAFVSARHPVQLPLAIAVAQSFAIDNGAFSAWKAGDPVKDWRSFYEFAGEMKRIPHCDFAVIPDVIDGTEADNDALLDEWPLPQWFGAPVWHMHESLERLFRLVSEWPRVCLGSSGAFSKVGTTEWWARMEMAMLVACDAQGRPLAKLHGLRMLDPKVCTLLPLTSADSTNIARNVNIDVAWKGTYQPSTKTGRAMVMRQRTETGCVAPAVWAGRHA